MIQLDGNLYGGNSVFTRVLLWLRLFPMCLDGFDPDRLAAGTKRSTGPGSRAALREYDRFQNREPAFLKSRGLSSQRPLLIAGLAVLVGPGVFPENPRSALRRPGGF